MVYGPNLPILINPHHTGISVTDIQYLLSLGSPGTPNWVSPSVLHQEPRPVSQVLWTIPVSVGINRCHEAYSRHGSVTRKISVPQCGIWLDPSDFGIWIFGYCLLFLLHTAFLLNCYFCFSVPPWEEVSFYLRALFHVSHLSEMKGGVR